MEVIPARSIFISASFQIPGKLFSGNQKPQAQIMKPMTRKFPAILGIFAGVMFFNQWAFSQMSTPPADPAELEALYTKSIENRTQEILKVLAFANEAKSNAVHDILISQYRVMRSRDALINAQLEAAGKDINYANRAAQLEAESKVLHDYFLARLGKVLTPEQIEAVKDKMTYNKVKVTYDAYIGIVPGLTAEDKAKILELLKAAREKAIDGGSAPEKSEIFQVYKNQINDYLNAHGHDVTKAYKDWEAQQKTTQSHTAALTSNTNAAQ
jgi:hypothetical protein